MYGVKIYHNFCDKQNRAYFYAIQLSTKITICKLQYLGWYNWGKKYDKWEVNLEIVQTVLWKNKKFSFTKKYFVELTTLTHCGKIKNLLSPKKLRQINYLVTSYK